MDILRPGYDRIRDMTEGKTTALEKEAVVVSLTNLMTFPFVRQAVDDGELTLHGLWTDIGEGGLEYWDPASERFKPV
jgi:carbonic anhydrase